MVNFSSAALNPPYRESIHPSKVVAPLSAPPPLKYELRVLEDGKTMFEKDLTILMRDGAKLYGDLYRPVDALAESTPTIVFFSPFGKHGAVPRELFQNMGVDFSRMSKYAKWELPDPVLWCPDYNYSLLIVDARATWWSEGDAAHYLSPEEGRDGYDIVEWVARQPWNTGRVGWGAVSYFAMSAYQVAVLKPPHLAAIMLWEAISDLYREVNAVGGIPSTPFQYFWMSLTGNGLTKSEDHAVLALEHPFYDEIWKSKVADWSKITIPAFSVTGWSSLALHLRGTIEAWKNFNSKEKYLWVHADREWAKYYSEEGIRKQKAFFDKFLKGEKTEVEEWPAVVLDVRTAHDQIITRAETTFPPVNSELVSLYLTGSNSLGHPGEPSNMKAAYVSYTSHDPKSVACFDYRFDTRTEITGYSSMKLHVQAIEYPDVDLYLALKKLDNRGKEVLFMNLTQKVEVPAALGWLRVSHREKDDDKSRPGRPVHTHRMAQYLQPSKIYEVEVEIWPSSTVWDAGDTLRLCVAGEPFLKEPTKVSTRHTSKQTYGEVRIWYGGEYDSQLFVPIYKA